MSTGGGRDCRAGPGTCPASQLTASSSPLCRDPNGFTDWTFSTVRCWGEEAQGTYRLVIRDTGGSCCWGCWQRGQAGAGGCGPQQRWEHPLLELLRAPRQPRALGSCQPSAWTVPGGRVPRC